MVASNNKFSNIKYYIIFLNSIKLSSIFLLSISVIEDYMIYINYKLKDKKMKKTFSFAILHFSVAFSVAYILTGSILIGGAMALIEPAINTVVFYFHDKVWKNIEKKKNKKNQSHLTTVAV